MSKKILSIEKGSGENSLFFKVKDQYNGAILGDKINRISEGLKTVSFEYGEDCKRIIIYSGFDEKENLLFEIEANSSLAIIYEV